MAIQPQPPSQQAPKLPRHRPLTKSLWQSKRLKRRRHASRKMKKQLLPRQRRRRSLTLLPSQWTRTMRPKRKRLMSRKSLMPVVMSRAITMQALWAWYEMAEPVWVAAEARLGLGYCAT